MTRDLDYSAVPLAHLADAVRAEYRAIFEQLVAEGQRRPLVLPYSIVGAFVVPTLWLAVPHSHTNSNSRWTRPATWLVVAFVVGFNLEVLTNTSSTNMAFAYAAGLASFWGILSTLNLLVWTKPQVDAARVVKKMESRPSQRKGTSQNGHAAQTEHQNGAPHENGLRKRTTATTASTSTADEGNETKGGGRSREQYYWQAFPSSGSFAERLNWAFDMTTNFRFTGWNWSISAIPRPQIPSITQIPNGSPVDMSRLTITTESGYRRRLSEHDFVQNRLLTILVQYLILDFLAVVMTKDPYFVLGPDNHHHPPLPPHLQSLPIWALRIYRQIFSTAGVLSAISGVFNLNDLAQFYLFRYLFPIRGELWQYPSTFGSFIQVLDRGLAGWWGAWWHQTFRVQFAAPARWLLRQGYLTRGTTQASIVALLVSFLQSGFLHASGSVSSIPHTKIWRTPVFFVLQAVGIALQQRSAAVLAERYPQQMQKVPRWATRVVNFVFAAAWLHATAGFFIDDMASSGIWLLEPVPFSFFRMFGCGFPGDKWWRWDEHHFPRWYSGNHWWQSGLAL